MEYPPTRSPVPAAGLSRLKPLPPGALAARPNPAPVQAPAPALPCRAALASRPSMSTPSFRTATLSDTDRCYQIEISAYEGDEGFARIQREVDSFARDEGRRPRILLRNGWQSINIGDIAHWLGMFELFERFEIDADIYFWPSNLENGADAMLSSRFPKVKVLTSPEAIKTAFKECDYLLHGSGSGFVAWKDAARWHKETGKPFGVMGISLTSDDPKLIADLSKADF
eukprot:gene9696-11900_t